MNNYSVKDYKTPRFEYTSLDKIHGVPTIDSLLRMFRQLKRNVQCVSTTLGGGCRTPLIRLFQIPLHLLDLSTLEPLLLQQRKRRKCSITT